MNYLQSTSLIDAFKIVTVLLHTVDPPTATLFLQLIQQINLFLIIFRNWETFTVNFAVETEQPLTMSGSA